MTTSNAVSSIKFDAAVNMNDVAAVFVSKYEDNLIARRDVLQNQVRAVKKSIEAAQNAAVQRIKDANSDKSMTIAALNNMKVEVVVAIRTADMAASVTVRANFDSSVRTYPIELFSFTAPFDDESKAKLNELNSELETATVELTRIINDLRDVSRKERQVRARISEMKLETMGMTDLLQNTDMIKLIQIG